MLSPLFPTSEKIRSAIFLESEQIPVQEVKISFRNVRKIVLIWRKAGDIAKNHITHVYNIDILLDIGLTVFKILESFYRR